MACGCSKKATVALGQFSKSMACLACAGPRTRCPHSPMVATVSVMSSQPCPKNRHPDRRNIVVKYGLRWSGIPMVDRVWLWVFYFSDIDWTRYNAKFPGCGCIRPLKALWLRGLRTMPWGKRQWRVYGH